MTFMILALGGLSLFCNGYVVAETEHREEEFFFQKWEEEVNESQDKRIGRILMKNFYFIPTIGAVMSWCKYKLQKKSL